MNRYITENNRIVYSFKELNDYDDFEEVEKIIKKYFELRIIDKMDAPYLRVWYFEIRNVKFKLCNDDSFGTELSTELNNSQLLKELVQKCEL